MTSTLELTIETSSLELTVAMKDHIQCHAVEMNVTIVSHTFAHSIIFHTEAGFHLVFIMQSGRNVHAICLFLLFYDSPRQKKLDV